MMYLKKMLAKEETLEKKIAIKLLVQLGMLEDAIDGEWLGADAINAEISTLISSIDMLVVLTELVEKETELDVLKLQKHVLELNKLAYFRGNSFTQEANRMRAYLKKFI